MEHQRLLLIVPLVLIAVAAKWGLGIAFVVGWMGFIVGMSVWGFLQFGRARTAIRAGLQSQGYAVIRMNYRWLRLGPYSLWNTSRSQLVYRVLAEERTGKQRRVWARWGRPWSAKSDTLELKWEE